MKTNINKSWNKILEKELKKDYFISLLKITQNNYRNNTCFPFFNKQLLENNIQNPKEYIYSKHNIDSLQFAESSAYYTKKRAIYKSIYDRLDLKLNAKKTAYETIIENQKRKKDSIKKSIEESSDSLSRDRKLKLKSKLKRPLKKFDTLPKRILK